MLACKCANLYSLCKKFCLSKAGFLHTNLCSLLCWLIGVVTDSAVYTTANSVSNSEIAFVRYAYVTIGAVIIIASVLHAVAYGLDNLVKHADSQPVPAQQTTGRDGETETGDNKKPTERSCREK